MSSSQTALAATLNYFYKLPIESLYYIFECMTEKDQLNFALTCGWIYRVFRIYHVGYALPKWFPIDITQNFDTSGNSNNELSNDELINIKSLPTERENVPNTPSSAYYRDGVIFDGKLYLIIFEKESPICWILDFEEIPLNWKRVKITFIEFESEEDSESLNSVENKKSENETETQKNNYQPLRFTVAAVISSMIYLFGGENIITGELNGTLYVLDPIKMELKKVMGQGGDIPSARKMHSLNAIGDQCLALFGGRCLMNDSNNPREYDTKEFHIYDITTKIWKIYRDPYDHIPYARCLHSTTVLDYSLYVYGGQQITSSTLESRIHDDDDLWCFTFNSTQQEDSADEEQNTPEESSSTSSKGSNKSRISSSFQNDKWQKLFSPRNNTSRAFSSGIGGEWHITTGNNVGRRCGAAMFNVGKRVAVLGGYERDNWNFIENENEKERTKSSTTSVTFEREVSKDLVKSSDKHSEDIIIESGRRYQKESDTNPWELCKLYLPDRKRWDQVKIAGFPEMECIAINQDHTNGIFVMGRKKGDTEKQGITVGWIKEEFSNI